MKLFRKIKHNWKWFAINAVGLSTAVACTLVIYMYTSQQLSYDRFHTKGNRIYRITANSNSGATSIHPARVAGDWPKQLVSDYPAIEKMVRLFPFRRAIIKIGDKRFYSEHAFSTDSTFFDIFNFKVLSGDPQKAFDQPNRAFISRSLAMKYFGSLDVVGKEISILHQQEPEPKVYTIDGVMEDFPVNSHFHADLLTSYTEVKGQTPWAYTYFLLKKGTDAKALQAIIQKDWEKDNDTGNPLPIIDLQKLTDIHLYSHKTREMEKNGDIRSILLLVSGGIIILFIALINFLNLSRVQFISEIKSIQVKRINGASKRIIAREMVSESLILSVLSIIVGLLAAYKISNYLNISIFQGTRMEDIAGISLLFIAVVALLSVIPLLTSKLVSDVKMSGTKMSLYTFPMVLQYTLAVIAITGTLVLNRQIDYINTEHPDAENANMVIMADNPWDAVQRYETFKTELLKHPSITEVTAAMEEPGGNILDGARFTMEGIIQKENQAINIFTTDSNFFSTMGIHPIAGTVDLGYTPSQQWEADAVKLSELRTVKNPDKKEMAELEKKLGGYSEKYILNVSALKMLGISNPKDAIGKRFRVNFFLPDLFPEGKIVGVVPDFHYTDLHSKERPLVITPRKMFNYCFLIGINPARREKAITTIAAVWKKVNPDYPFQYEYITDSYKKVYATEYSQTKALSLFALISIILSSLGIFAMASFSTQRRTKEIGIRKVNGAKVSQVMAMLNKDFVKWVAIAFVIATPVAWYVMDIWLDNFAYKTTLSWWIFALSGILAVGIALLTVSFQSYKTATRNPVEALRYE